MSDYLDKIQTQKKDGTPLATVPFRDSEAREDITTIQNELTTDTTTIEGNPLNFTTLSAQNAKSTILSVEPIQDLHGYDKPWVGGAGKNLFDISLVNTSNFNISDLTISNKVTDARTYFSFQLQKYKNGSLVGAALLTRDIDRTGEIAIGFTLSGDDYDSIRLKHNGTSADIEIALIPFTKSGSFAISFNVLGANPNSVDGLKFSNIQIEVGSQATSYEPYENICPISGRSEIGILGCGKNLLSPSATSEHNTRYVTKGGTLNSNIPDGSLVLKSGTYTFSLSITAIFIEIRNSESNEIASTSNSSYLTFTLSTDSAIKIAVDKTNADWDNLTYQIEKGNQATSYEPYAQSNDHTIDLGQTVYGGTLDVENGVLVVDRANVKLSTLNFSIQSGTTVFSADIMDGVSEPPSATGKPSHFITDCYEVKSIGPSTSYPDEICAWQGYTSYNKLILRIRDEQYASKEDFINARGDNYICYELATPITINLTPHTIKLLEGVNNISTDGDKITLTYREGEVATLGDLTSAVDNLDSKIDESKILTDTATGDKYILVVTNGVLSVEQISN